MIPVRRLQLGVQAELKGLVKTHGPPSAVNILDRSAFQRMDYRDLLKVSMKDPCPWDLPVTLTVRSTNFVLS